MSNGPSPASGQGGARPRTHPRPPLPALAEIIRPSGYFRVKAERLRGLCRWYLERGGIATLETRDTETIRADLLAVHGIGPETADDILLYALDRPVFVIDAYTRRLFARLGWIEGHEDYEALRARIERFLGPDVPLYQEYHALIVHHAKGICRTRPDRGALLPRRTLPLARRRSIPGGRVLQGGAKC